MNRIIAIITTFYLSLPAMSHACPGCGDILDAKLGYGFNLSILFMMAMPFAVMGSIAAGVFFINRNRSARSSGERQQTIQNQKEDQN